MAISGSSRKQSIKVAQANDVAKRTVIESITKGFTVKESLALGKRSYSWYQNAKKRDPEFGRQVELAKVLSTRGSMDKDYRKDEAGEFQDFRRKYLQTETWPHQQCWVDLLEGREPSWQHPSFIYEKGRAQRLLVNVPPNHSKSTTITIDYATWRICRDPNVRIIIISKTQAMAKKFLYGITSRLTHPRYAELQKMFAPEGGFKASADKWAANQIYLGGEDKDSGEPHPTVEALGIGGQVYGARADLIICDDCVTLSNAGDWEKQMDWLRQEASTRLGPSGKLLVIGTRVAPQDLYRELRNPDHYTDNRSPWTYFAQPAILGNAQKQPEEWETLWPVSERPFEGAEDDDVADADGNFPRWTGPRLAELRNDLGSSRWAMVYMQADVAAEPIFDSICVRGSVEGMRKRGPLVAGAPGYPKNPEGFYIICSMDPAMAGETATIAYAVDRETQKRYVLDVSIMPAPTPLRIRELIHQWTELYKPNEWVIESNAFQLFLTQDEEIRGFLATRGIPLKPHHTGFNKQDAEFGVASLQPLFGTKEVKGENQGYKHSGNNLISLPDIHKNEAVKALIEQLVLWDPNVKTKHRKQDAVMALWFAELKAREVLSSARRGEQWFMENPFTSQRDRDRRSVIPLDEYAATGGRMSFL